MSSRETDVGHLHPEMRLRSLQLQAKVEEAKLPIQRYESWRDPRRQALLYATGRVPGVGVPGHHVTKARAWESAHQYGFAEDWVWWWNGAWTWAPPAGHSWDEFHQLASGCNLDRLSFEDPHVQLPGIDLPGIRSGRTPWPGGGDDAWEENVDRAVVAWGRANVTDHGILNPGAPPLVTGRPALVVPAAAPVS
jgi:hypothetical protein